MWRNIMAKRLQLRRGTTAENDAFPGAQGELTYDTQKKQVRIHDGSTAGGFTIDPIVAFQEPTPSNNYTWYRLYRSGWIEQGGSYSWNVACSKEVTITYPKQMKYDVNHIYVTRPKGQGDVNAYDGDGVKSQSKTGFVSGGFSNANAASNSFVWFVMGMAA